MVKDSKENLIPRRELLCGMCALGLGVPALSQAQPPEADALLPPQENDQLVFAFGSNEGQRISVEDLAVNAKQIFAYPMDPESALVRNGTRLNQVVLIKLDDDTLAQQTAERAVNGIVAYSGVCTHTGCDVTDWNSEFKRFQCPCHESQFDPSDSARVVGGPAPGQLAALPLKSSDGIITVAGAFEGRLGFQQPGLTPFGI